MIVNKIALDCLVGSLWFGLLGPFVGGLAATMAFVILEVASGNFPRDSFAGAPIVIVFAYVFAWAPAMVLGAFVGPFRRMLISPLASTVVGLVACVLCMLIWYAVDPRSIYGVERVLLWGGAPAFAAGVILSLLLGVASRPLPGTAEKHA